MGYKLTGRTYCDKEYTRIVGDDEAPPKTGRILLGNAGTEISDEVAVAVGLKRGKAKAGAEDKDDSASDATEAKDGSVETAKPAVRHIGGGIYETPAGTRIKGRAEALELASTEAGKSEDE